MIKTLLETLNAYSKEYANTCNTALLPAIGRIKENNEGVRKA